MYIVLSIQQIDESYSLINVYRGISDNSNVIDRVCKAGERSSGAPAAVAMGLCGALGRAYSGDT